MKNKTKNKIKSKPYLLGMIFVVLAVLFLQPAMAADGKKALPKDLPDIANLKSGVTVYGNEKAEIDATNAEEGFVKVRYLSGENRKLKVQITKKNSTTYTYNLNNKGNGETFPFSQGDGEYAVKIFENTTGNKYALAFGETIQVALRNDFLPFLYPNQYVNFSKNSAVVKKAAELAKGKDTMKIIEAEYHYVVNNFNYDYQLAKTVSSGYLPNVDAVYKSKKGICFDYAAVMAAMLRSQGIPTKLVVGYAGKTYHAWINVYVESVGWIDKAIYFDGKNWSLMDPTFASTGKSSKEILKYIADDSNYSAKYAY